MKQIAKSDPTFRNLFVIFVSNSTPLEPVVLYSFPLNSNDSNQSKAIIEFCFPDLDDLFLFTEDKPRSEFFTFVLTEADGAKKFGFTKRSLDATSAKATCFLSDL